MSNTNISKKTDRKFKRGDIFSKDGATHTVTEFVPGYMGASGDYYPAVVHFNYFGTCWYYAHECTPAN